MSVYAFMLYLILVPVAFGCLGLVLLFLTDSRPRPSDLPPRVDWSGWPVKWEERLEILSAAESTVVRPITNNGMHTSRVLLHAALAECKMHLAAETVNSTEKGLLLSEAKAFMVQAIHSNPNWTRSDLAKQLTTTLMDYAHIRTSARLLNQGARSPGCGLSQLPDEVLTKIAGFTGNPAVHSEAESEEIAREYFCRPTVNTEAHVTQGYRSTFFEPGPRAYQTLQEESTSNLAHRLNV